MDPVSVRLVKSSLVWLLAGFTLGALMLSDPIVPGDWRLWFAPTHGHMLFVGWFLQFALGVGYWLLPRKRSPELPFSYPERPAFIGWALLNIGLALRVIAEPLRRTGEDGWPIELLLALSGIAQLIAIALFVRQIWPRIMPRPPRQNPSRPDG